MTTDRPLRIVLVAALAATAGCSGVVGQDAGARTERVTPAPVPTLAPTTPPGVGPDGIDAAALVSSHRRTLGATSYTLETDLRYGPIDGEYYGETSRRQIGERGEPVAVVRNRSEHDSPVDWTRYALWYDGEETVIQQTHSSGRRDRAVYDVSTPSAVGYVGVVDTAFSTLARYSVEPVPNGTVVEGRFTRTDVMPGPAFASNRSDATLRALVHEDGYVRGLAVAYDATVDGERVHVRFSMRVRAVGTTVVTEPAWVSTGGTAAAAP